MADGTITIAVDLDSSQLETALSQIGSKASSVSAFKQLSNDIKASMNNVEMALGESMRSQLSIVSGEVQSIFSNVINIINTQGVGGLAAAIGSILTGIAATIWNYTPQFVASAVEVIRSLSKSLSDNAKDIMNTGFLIVDNLINGIIQALPSLLIATVAILNALFAGLQTYAEPILSAAAEIINQLCIGIVQATPALLAAVAQIIVQAVNALTNCLPTVLAAITSIAFSIVEMLPGLLSSVITALAPLLQGIVNFFVSAAPELSRIFYDLYIGIVNVLPQITQTVVAALPQLITGIVQFFMESVTTIVQAATELFTAIVDALPQVISTIVAALPQLITSIINTILNGIPQLMQAGIDLLIALIDGLPQIITTIVSALPQIIMGIVNGLIGAIPQIILTGVQLLVSLIENLPAIIVTICQAAPEIINGLISAFASLAGSIMDIGKNLLEGIWQGISSAAGWLWEKVKEWAGGLLDNIKGLFGINSPSRVFRDEIGKQLVAGIAAGIELNGDLVTAALEDLNSDMLESERLYNAERKRIDEERALEEEAEAREDYFKRRAEAEDRVELAEIEAEETKRLKRKAQDEELEALQEKADNERAIMDALKDDITSVYDDIAEHAQEKLGAVEDSRQSLEDKLRGASNIAETVKLSIGSYTDMADYAAQNEQKLDYINKITELRDRMNRLGYAEETIQAYMDEVQQMDMGEAMGFLRVVRGKSDEEFQKNMDAYQYGLALDKQLATSYYNDDMQRAYDESFALMEARLNELGLEIPEGFFTSGSVSAEQFGKAFREELDAQMAEIRSIVENYQINITPHVQLSAAAGGTVRNNTYNDNIVIYSANPTVTAQDFSNYETRRNQLLGGSDV